MVLYIYDISVIKIKFNWNDRSFNFSFHLGIRVETLYEPRHEISNNVAFWHEWTYASLFSLLLSLETPNYVHSVAQHS